MKALSTAVACSAFLLASLATAPSHAQSTYTSPLLPEPQSAAAEVAGLMRAGKNTEALKRSEEILKDQPRNLQTRFMRAVLLADLGRKPEAVAEYERMTQEYPEIPEPYNNLAVLLAAQGQLTRASALLQQALAAHPQYATAYENLGDIYLARAVDAYKHATEHDAGNAPLQAKLKSARDQVDKLAPSK